MAHRGFKISLALAYKKKTPTPFYNNVDAALLSHCSVCFSPTLILNLPITKPPIPRRHRVFYKTTTQHNSCTHTQEHILSCYLLVVFSSPSLLYTTTKHRTQPLKPYLYVAVNTKSSNERRQRLTKKKKHISTIHSFNILSETEFSSHFMLDL